MSTQGHDKDPMPEENDALWELLGRNASAHPVVPDPWFATRVAALALATPQQGRRSPSSMLRWLIPIPLACTALLALVSLMAWNHSRESEERFERHMEFLASSPFDDYGV